MAEERQSIPAAARTFEALRDIGYDFNSAVADLIDNSITQGKAKNLFIYFDKIKVKSAEKIIFRLFDDGIGMEGKFLQEAMRIGSENDSYSEGDLSKYGMGMKTASLSQCDVLTVISKSENRHRAGYKWDMHLINARNDWFLLKLDSSEINNEINHNDSLFKEMFQDTSSSFFNGPHWTLVAWDDLFDIETQFNSRSSKGFSDRFLDKTLASLIIHLRLTFHRFLAGENVPRKINININGLSIKPLDPFCRDQTHTSVCPLNGNDEILFNFSGEIKHNRKDVRIKRYILPAKTGNKKFDSNSAWEEAKGNKSWNDSQGYYIYRNNRLISYGGWLKTKSKDEHDKLARVSIDFTDHHDSLIRIDVKKTKIQIPDDFFNFLKNTVNNKYIKSAKDRYSNADERVVRTKNSVREKSSLVSHVSEALINESKIKVKENKIKGQIEVQNSHGSFIVDDLIYKTLESNLRFEEQDFKDDKIFWKFIPNPDCGFQIIINKSHPLYEKYYFDVDKNKPVTAVLDSFLFTLAFIELKCRTSENHNLFQEIREVASEVLKKFVNEKII
jgi:hypothetical protein